MVICIIGVGVYPAILTDMFDSALEPMVRAINDFAGGGAPQALSD